MEQIIKIDPTTGVTAEEAIRLNTLKHQITTATENFLTDIGAFFKEAQEILSKNKTGSFQRFVEECGYNTKTVERMINRYNLIATNGRDIEYLETLPTRVLSAAGAKNAPPELTQAVVNGEIKTMKELEEWKKKYQDKMARVIELSNRLAEKQEEIEALKKNGAPGEIIKVVDEDAIEEAIEEATKAYQEELEQKINQIRQTEALLEDKEHAITLLSDKQKKAEREIVALQNELQRLVPLKKKAEEIEKIKTQLDKREQELRVINLDMDVYKAIREAKEMLHAKVFPLATIIRAPEQISDNIKNEIRNIHELMNNFIVATTEKFKVNR